MPIYGDLYQNLQWSLTFNLKVVIHLKSASEASYDVINMAIIIRNCPLIKAIVCVGMVIFIQHERFFNIISIILVTYIFFGAKLQLPVVLCHRMTNVLIILY